MASFDNNIIKIFNTYINNKNKQKIKTDVFLEEGYLVNCLGTVPYFFLIPGCVALKIVFE